MKKLKTLLHSNFFFSILLIGTSFYVIHAYFFKQSVYTEDDYEFKGTILSKKINGNQVTLELKAKEKMILFYYFDKEELKKISSYQLGDTVVCTGKLTIPSTNRNFDLFNYQNYLKGKQIFWILKVEQIKKIKSANFFYQLKNNIIKKIEQSINSDYLFAFLLGDSSKLEKKEAFQELGISHLFAVSGMHIVFLTSFLLSLFNKITKKKILSFIFVSLILYFYVWMLSDSASANRAYLLFLFSFLNQHYNLNFSSMKLLGFVLIILLLKNPFVFMQVGFQFSFLLCAFFNLQKQEQSSYFKTLFKTSLLAFLVSFPLSSFHFHQVHLGSILFNMIAIPFVSFLLFPLSFLSFFFPILSFLLDGSILIFHFFLRIFEHFSNLKLVIKAYPFYQLLFYYGILFLSFTKNKKWLIVFTALALYHLSAPYLDQHYWIDMIDVGQGDAILIRFPHLTQTILVDTGGIISYKKSEENIQKKSQTETILLPYLKSLGIKELDLLILTHGDQDHLGNAEDLLEKIKISKVYMNRGNNNELEENLLKKLKQKKIPVFQIDRKIISIKNNTFQFLNAKNETNENEDSLIFYTELNHYHILFMGDAGKITENKLIQEYNLPKMDILKVGHHGSKTSTSEEFLNVIKPSIALLSAGVDNSFGHPHPSVLTLLKEKNSHILSTNCYGSIRLQLKKPIKIKVRYHPPRYRGSVLYRFEA